MSDDRAKKVGVLSYGCRANQYDSAALEALLGRKGYEVVDATGEADYFVVNSCAITEQAEMDARQTLRRLKRQHPQAKIVFTGCSAQVSAEKYKKEGLADLVVGNEFKAAIAAQIDELASPTHDRSARFASVFYEGGVKLARHSRSFLKIQDGCSQFCSFCIVPFARGLNRSIPAAEILKSLRDLASSGIPEVVLTGIHLGTYGKDLIPKMTLLDLLKLIEAETQLPRIRLSSIDPEEVSDEMIALLAASKRYCEHLHLPVQSGDALILKQMKRRYHPELFFELTHKLKKQIPDICIGTDVIVGFPGEDESAFENTLNLIRNSPVAYIHVFPYSPREGTLAAGFEETVSNAEKKRRVHVLRKLSDQKKQAFNQSQLGRPHEMVIEHHKRGKVGLTRNYISAQLDYIPHNMKTIHAFLNDIDQGQVRARPFLDAGVENHSYEV